MYHHKTIAMVLPLSPLNDIDVYPSRVYTKDRVYSLSTTYTNHVQDFAMLTTAYPITTKTPNDRKNSV